MTSSPKSERERLATEFAENYLTMNGRPPHRPDVLKHCFEQGYDAALNGEVVKAMEKALDDCICDGETINGKWTNHLSLGGETSTQAEEALEALKKAREE